MSSNVGVECLSGRLRIRFPRKLFGGKQKYLALGLDDTPTNRAIAASKIKLIEADIELKQFDPTLARYQDASARDEKKSRAVSTHTMWVKYAAYKAPSLSPKTVVDTYGPIGKLLQNSPQSLDKPLVLRSHLLSVTSEQMTRRVLMHLSAACKWGLKHKLIAENHFDGMYRELPQPRYEIEEQANPFTEDERDAIIEAFRTHGTGRKGISYQFYTPLVTFLFRTGCRPSEAVGLRWKHINEDCTKIRFTCAIVMSGGKALARDQTKTHKSRTFPCNRKLQTLLLELKCSPRPDDLVFPGRKGRTINYTNFSARGWTKITESLGLDQKNGMHTTPYCCRDTFITIQALKGVSSDIIAAWVGNSAETIRKHYLCRLALEGVIPSE